MAGRVRVCEKLRHLLIELGGGGGQCRSPDVDVSLYRGHNPRQSLVENLWKRNRNTAVVRWVNTNPEPRPRPPTQKMENRPQQTQGIAVK